MTHSSWQKITVPSYIKEKKELILALAKEQSIHPLLMYQLFLAGIQSEKGVYHFLHPSSSHYHSPFLLNEMKEAVVRIIQAIHRKEQIMIFGDYDADGITSTTLLTKGIQMLGGNVTARLPRREEGYGLSAKVMNDLPEGISLILTVDNGTSAHEAIKIAYEKGIDVIVTDHHEVLGVRPNCYAFINPKRSDNTYPFPYLAGAGVALKMVQALFETLKLPFSEQCKELVMYACIGTIADLMPLTDENRLITWLGLRYLNEESSFLPTLFRKLLKIKQFDSTTIGFSVGPIFNAMGRISDPNILLDLLLRNHESPDEWAKVIETNTLRKNMTAQHVNEANELIRDNGWAEDAVIVIHGEFHAGIIGLIASRVAERQKKPCIVINHHGVGSARSGNVPGFSIIQAIQSCGFLLKKFGGHTAAAGFSITPDELHISCFRHAIQQAAKRQAMKPIHHHYLVNCQIDAFPDTLFSDMARLEPFGMKNPKPAFQSRLQRPNFIKQMGEEHLLLGFGGKNAFAFSKGNLFSSLTKRPEINVLYTTNCYQKCDFLIKDIAL
ncbi:single-stranded-DNA-specific exonuclease RecJ [Gottfriedia sp. NPDC057991]|uniref:single-stranded-DNA-specific exonuclease RecJ n=1 Tax=Gottfriedia sp. NPDC057991 TaxID=3346298 RepID=UPI0036D87CC3